jgi:hypothetical protein
MSYAAYPQQQDICSSEPDVHHHHLNHCCKITKAAANFVQQQHQQRHQRCQNYGKAQSFIGQHAQHTLSEHITKLCGPPSCSSDTSSGSSAPQLWQSAIIQNYQAQNTL